jgi:hypothetical protein
MEVRTGTDSSAGGETLSHIIDGMRLGLGTSGYVTVEFDGGAREYSANSIWPRRRVDFDTDEIRAIAPEYY